MKSVFARLAALEASATAAENEKITLIFDDGTQKRVYPPDGIGEMIEQEGKPKVIDIVGGDGEPVVRLLRGLLEA